jgi:hypothetical protein
VRRVVEKAAKILEETGQVPVFSASGLLPDCLFGRD